MGVGQLAAIAAGNDHGWHATAIAVRHEASGPVILVNDNGGPGGQTLTIAGRRVAIGPGRAGLRTVRPGEWLAVSGPRHPEGVIAASLIDLGTPGSVPVPGRTMPSGARRRIGYPPVRPPRGTQVPPGEIIIAPGTIVNGTMSVATSSPDVLHSDPAAYFRSHERRWVNGTYVSGTNG